MSCTFAYRNGICLGLLVTVAGSLLGCAPVGPDYVTPVAPIQNQWLQYEDPRLNTEAPVEPQWWKHAFGDPALDRLVQEAMAGNLTLRSAALRIVQARQQLAIARGFLLPQDQAIGAAVAIGDPGARQSASTTYSLNFTFAWELDVWGRFRRQIESASANYDATISAYDGVRLLLVSQVAQTYLSIVTTEQRLSVNRQNLKYQEESVRLSLAKFEAGDTSALDAEQALTLFHNTEAAIAQLELNLQLLKIAMATLLGRPPQDLEEFLSPVRPIPTVSPQLAIGMPQDLLRRRPDIRVAERALAAQSAQIGVAVSDLYPQLGLTGLIGPAVNTATGQEFLDIFDRGSVGYSFGGVVRWNVLNYGRIEGNVRLQDARFQQLVEDYRQTVLQAQAEVESSLAAYFQSLLRLEALRQAAEAAKRAADISFEQYQEGLVDFDTVVTTLQALLAQQDQLVSVQGSVAASLVDVYRSLGGGWEILDGDHPEDLIPPETRQEMEARGWYWSGNDRRPSGNSSKTTGQAP